MLLDDDPTRLSHISDATQEALGYVKTLDREAFEQNRPMQHAIIRCLTIVGEASARLSLELRNSNAHIPWPRIIATRNRIVHAYFDLDLDLIWHTATHELPILLNQIEQIRDQIGESTQD